jgi:hypothetical protein
MARWRAIIFSDECSIEIGKGRRKRWCFRLNYQGEKWKKENISPYKKGKGISVMVWGAIWGSSRSDIIFLERDPTSKHNGYSGRSYLAILEEALPTIWEPGLIFMQDNAPIHASHLVKNWLSDNMIPVLKWPPYSPDLNPIEHAWVRLKETAHALDPGLEEYGGGEDVLKEHLAGLTEQAWSEISQDYFDRLVESMPRRIKAVINAGGWYTKY